MASSMDRPITVLHVDDDPLVCDLVSDVLGREDAQLVVETETGAAEALDRFADDRIDCIVSDYDMPEMTGLDLLREVRTDHPEVPFILFTGKGSEEIASDAISAGVTDYLQKGGGLEQYSVLANRITNAVEQRRATRLVESAFQAIDHSREGIAFLDEHDEFIYLNDAFASLLGFDRDTLLGEAWETVYPQDQVDRLEEELLPAVTDGGNWSGETVYRRQDDDRLLVNQSISYTDEGMKICVVRTVTDAGVQERTLKEERRQFELFIQSVEDYAIFMLDTDGTVVTWNAGAERIKGYTEEEIVGEHVSIFYTPEQRAAGYPETLLQRARDEGRVEHRGPRVRKDGSTFDASVTITAVYDTDDNLRGYGKVTRDLNTAYHDPE